MKKLAVLLISAFAVLASCNKEEVIYSWDCLNSTSWQGIYPTSSANMAIGTVTIGFSEDGSECTMYRGLLGSLSVNRYNYYVERSLSLSDEKAKKYVFDLYMTKDHEGGKSYYIVYKGQELELHNVSSGKDDVITLKKTDIRN